MKETTMVDIQKFVEKEAEGIPQILKPVFERATKGDIDEITMTMSYMAYAYGKGFTEYAARALDDWPKRDYIIQPMVYLARHSMELYLKWAINEYQDYLGDFSEKTDHHGLIKLWNSLIKLMEKAGAPTDTDYSKHCLQLLKHINETDPDGEQFRYPHNKKGETFELAKVDLEELVKAHYHVSTYAEGAVMTIPDLAEEE
jgi:hypothetical protein